MGLVLFNVPARESKYLATIMSLLHTTDYILNYTHCYATNELTRPETNSWWM